MLIEKKIITDLIAKKYRISIAESCTGGLLSHRLTNVPGSSQTFIGSIVAYSNDIKSGLLGVSEETLKRKGAVSADTAIAMAKGCLKLFKTDFGVGITGIAGPSGGTKKKPIGLTFIAVSIGEESLCLECIFTGTRAEVKRFATQQALKLIKEFLD
ncbi:MAG: CinA family protein [Candidatus Omnitrophica bacterium]|nr:CinA family protein [Candidatus Omnitrophota bacterium]